MKIKINKRFLMLPINTKTSIKKFFLCQNDKILYDFECKIDVINPNFTAYVDVYRFIGETVEIKVEPNMSFNIEQSDDMIIPNLYKEEYRPQVHFTVKNGWNNDPNGLIKIDDTYHMFYQYNPCSTEWGSMHWGHAISKDLLHWEHQNVALFPDELGTMYSGSAIEDTDNVSGLGNKVLLFYTAAGGSASALSKGKDFSQCLAYSNDGVSFTKYHKNPIVNNISKGNRDPKVVYVDELEKYLMVLYLDGDNFTMLVSENLIDWERYCDFRIDSDDECPDIFSFFVDGKKVWVVAAASDYYVTGHFEKSGFVIDSKPKTINYSADISYAAQSFSSVNKVIRIAWNRTTIPENGFSQQMSFPTEMSLEKIDNEYYLSALPIADISNLYENVKSYENFQYSEKIIENIGKKPVLIEFECSFENGTIVDIFAFGYTVRLDMSRNICQLKNLKMPLSLQKNTVKIKILIDRCSYEVFADDGKYFFTSNAICDYNLPYVSLSANKKIKVSKLKLITLKSIY